MKHDQLQPPFTEGSYASCDAQAGEETVPLDKRNSYLTLGKETTYSTLSWPVKNGMYLTPCTH
jgi:hypothetical protein